MFESTHNTLRPEFLQVHALQPFVGSISASRGDMFASEIGQAPPLKGAEIRRIQTGMEREFGRYTSMIKMPKDAVIRKVIHKRTPKGLIGGNGVVTGTLVIYRDIDGVFGSIYIPVNSLNHQKLGFDFHRTQKLRGMQAGQHIAGGTVLARSPSIDDAGNYRYGLNGKVAFMSIPEVIQDGAVISESFAKKAEFKGYGTHVLSIGENTVGLNLFGDENEYKLFPDVGDFVKPSGLIFGTREIDESLAPVQLSRWGLRVEEETDRRTYVERNAQVIDIDIVRNHSVKPTLPTGTDAQCHRYWEMSKEYYRDIITEYNKICSELGNKNPPITGPFQELMVTAYSRTYDGSRGGGNLGLVVNGNPLNEWTVTVTVRYDLLPTVSYKMADDSGGKAVIVNVWPDEKMPIDKDGNRADVIMDAGSIVNRLNPSRMYEQYITAVMMRLTKEIRELAGSGNMTQATARLMGFYKLMSPRMYDMVQKVNIDRHMNEVVRDGIYLWLPTDNEVYYPRAMEKLREHYPPCFDTVTYISSNGKHCSTEQPVLIGEQYFIFLEKIGDDYSAVSSPVMQAQGIPGKLTRGDKHASPGRPQAIRALGETEDRIVASLVDPDAPVDMLDMSNSPPTHKHVVNMLLKAPQPTNIQNILDRKVIPRGNNRVTQHMANHLMASGFEFVQRPVED
jgi:hypothetical protein